MWVGTIRVDEGEQRELLSAFLFSIGAEGVHEVDGSIEAYFDDSCNLDRVMESWNDLPLRHFKIDFRKQEAQNWNEIWESNFEPVQITEEVGIRSTFHDKLNSKYELIINPKMSFGTGHHDTTIMMMTRMLELNFDGKKVLDFGTGTAVLAILASKLKASAIIAIDNDQDSIDNSKENVALNNANNIDILKGEKETIPSDSYDIILANITRNVLIDSFADLNAALAASGEIVMSGFFPEDIPKLLSHATKSGFVEQSRTHQGKWSCLSLKKRN